jgi:hypothetical protein
VPLPRDRALGFSRPDLRGDGAAPGGNAGFRHGHAIEEIYYFEVRAVLLHTLTKKNLMEVVFFHREGTASIIRSKIGVECSSLGTSPFSCSQLELASI